MRDPFPDRQSVDSFPVDALRPFGRQPDDPGSLPTADPGRARLVSGVLLIAILIAAAALGHLLWGGA